MRTGPCNSPLSLSVCLCLSVFLCSSTGLLVLVVMGCECVSVWQGEKGVAEIICIGVHGDAELLEIHLTLILFIFFF